MSVPSPECEAPQWAAPAAVAALMTTRRGGVSSGPFGDGAGGGGCNLGAGADHADAVAANRALLRGRLPAEPSWLRQVHGTRIVDAATGAGEAADGAYAVRPGIVCAVLVADCLPVLLADRGGRGVAAAHAGWRGLAAGVLQECARALRAALGDPGAELIAWLGPAIGPGRFEVGPEVFVAMRARLPRAEEAFEERGAGRLHADLFALARQALAPEGVVQVAGGGRCTASEPETYYSFRRDRVTGRQAALVWLRDGSRGI